MLFLTSRVLLEDGKTLIEPQQASHFLSCGMPSDQLLVTELTDEIKQFNKLTSKKIEVFIEFPHIAAFEWIIPDEYKYLDVENYMLELAIKAHREDDPLKAKRELRLAEELVLFEEHKMLTMVKTLIFIVDKLNEQRVVWGVGRGSSCSSYILFLIGLHHVDPVKYEIDIKDFIRNENRNA